MTYLEICNETFIKNFFLNIHVECSYMMYTSFLWKCVGLLVVFFMLSVFSPKTKMAHLEELLPNLLGQACFL